MKSVGSGNEGAARQGRRDYRDIMGKDAVRRQCVKRPKYQIAASGGVGTSSSSGLGVGMGGAVEERRA